MFIHSSTRQNNFFPNVVDFLQQSQIKVILSAKCETFLLSSTTTLKIYSTFIFVCSFFRLTPNSIWTVIAYLSGFWWRRQRFHGEHLKRNHSEMLLSFKMLMIFHTFDCTAVSKASRIRWNFFILDRSTTTPNSSPA